MSSGGSKNDAAWSRELRLAPVMTGGTSLAVWMGGAACEIYRMVHAGNHGAPASGLAKIYSDLLKLTNTKPRVDVITGTSAGGLNGTLLASAWKLDIDPSTFDDLQEFWLSTGELSDLVRSPNEPDPPSLLNADDKFAGPLVEVLTDWARRTSKETTADEFASTPAKRPVDLFLTLTTITGDAFTQSDSFDQPIEERKYTSGFRFREKEFPASRGAIMPDTKDIRTSWIHRLATASRTTASIPFVFELSHIDVRDVEKTAKNRPNFKGVAQLDYSRWTMDGGVANNLPLGQAIDRVYDQPAGDQLRRVFLYIRPTPNTEARAGHEDLDKMPAIGTSIAATLNAWKAEGVVADVQEIKEHNLQILRAQEARAVRLRHLTNAADDAGLVSGTNGETVSALFDEAQKSFEAFLDLRALRSVSNMMDSVQQLRARRRVNSQPVVVSSAKQRREIERKFQQSRADSLPRRMSLLGSSAIVGESEPNEVVEGAPTFGEPADDTGWTWGISSLEHSCAILLASIDALLNEPKPRENAATSLADLTAHRLVLAEAREQTYVAFEVLEKVRKLDSEYWDIATTELSTSEVGEDPLATEAQHAYASWPDLAEFTSKFGGHAQQSSRSDYQAAIDRLKDARSSMRLQRGSTSQGEDGADIREQSLPKQQAVLGLLREVGMYLGEILGEVAASASAYRAYIEPSEAAGIDTADGDRQPLRRSPGLEAAYLLEALATVPEGVKVQAGTPDRCRLLNLLSLHVLDATNNVDRKPNEQMLELMQVSWNGTDELTGRSPDHKLAGPELGRLGAFLKQSWRANDWFWGRMDAVDRLARLLLDPARLYQLRVTPEKVIDLLDEVARDATGLPIFDEKEPAGDEATQDARVRDPRWAAVYIEVKRELSLLDDPDLAVEDIPHELPRAAEILTFFMQLHVTRSELPRIKRALELSKNRGGIEADGGNFRLAMDEAERTWEQQTPEQLIALLKKMRIGEESVGKELKGDHLLSTMTQIVTVATKALTGKKAGIGVLARAIQPIRRPAELAHTFVQNATSRGRVAQGISVLLLVLSGVFAALTATDVDLPTGIAPVAIAVLVGSLIVGAVRGRVWSTIPFLVLIGIAGIAIAGDLDQALLKCPSGKTACKVPRWKEWGFTNAWSAALLLLIFTSGLRLWALITETVSTERSLLPKLDQDRARRKLAWRWSIFGAGIPLVLFNFTWVSRRILLGRDVGFRKQLLEVAAWAHERNVVVSVVLFAAAGWLLSAVWAHLAGVTFKRASDRFRKLVGAYR